MRLPGPLPAGFHVEEAPGASVVIATRPATRAIPSCYARGLATYPYLDLTPLGRHEEGLPYPMDWVRLRLRYESPPASVMLP